MRATQLRPACALSAAHGPSSLRAVHDAAPVCTRRQLHSGAVAALLLGLCPQAAVAAAADVDGSGRRRQTQQIEEAYDGYAATYDELDGGAAAESLGFPALRQQLLAQARGDVLETAVGTGLNLPLYDLESGGLASLTAIDLSGGMLAQARRRAEQLGLAERTRLELVQADVEQLQTALAGRQFDTVVDTFSLCVFPDPLAALRSMAACLRPGGTLLLLEHSRSGFGPLAAYQDLTAPAVAATGKGCRWNDDVPGLVAASGLQVQRVEPHVGGLIVSLSAVKPAQPA